MISLRQAHIINMALPLVWMSTYPNLSIATDMVDRLQLHFPVFVRWSIYHWRIVDHISY
jgi:hypothetical protein